MPKYRPHGTTETYFDSDKLQRRIIRRKKNGKTGKVSVTPQSIVVFSNSDSDYLLSATVSLIDKIAKKPDQGSKITFQQYKFRRALGSEVLPTLHKLDIDPLAFYQRLHPYFDKPLTKADLALEPGDKGYPFRTESDDRKAMPKGRWYYAFFGSIPPREANTSGIGVQLMEHIKRQYRARGRSGEYEKPIVETPIGQARQRGLTASNSVLRPHSDAPQDFEWGEAEWETYSKAGNYNLPAKIVGSAEAKETTGYAFGFRAASEHLFEHYAKVFPAPEQGGAIPVKDLNEDQRRILKLHDDVKAFYKSRLRGERSVTAAKYKMATAGRSLPKTWNALRDALGFKSRNSELMSLVRTGKVIHYDNDENTADLSLEGITDISGSVFWTSACQEEIKRAEAFVRIWRTVLGFSTNTFANWMAPDDTVNKDILFEGWRAASNQFEKPDVQDAFHDKAIRLFGREAADITAMTVDRRTELVSHLRATISALRNNSFHFKGLHNFVNSFSDLEQDPTGFSQKLMERDQDARADRLATDLTAVGIFDFMSPERADQVVKAIIKSPPRSLAIPQFKRMLKRYDGAWTGAGRDKFPSSQKSRVLPKPGKRVKMEADPALRCQYVCMKSLYETAFPDWLEAQENGRINEWLGEAQTHSTMLAKVFKADAVSKVERKDYTLASDEDLWSFFDRLGHDVATENRALTGYDPDKDKAQDNSEFLENFKRDVIMLAYVDYLHDAGFSFLEKLDHVSSKGRQSFSANALNVRSTHDIHIWQQSLYMILHLVPVGLVSLLNQQFQKWQAVYSKRSARTLEAYDTSPLPGFADAQAAYEFSSADGYREVQNPLDQLMYVVDLYLDMHDAKFTRKEGDDGLGSTGDIDAYFEDPSLAKVFFPDDPKVDAEGKLPIRGLREMTRFGATSALDPIYANAQIRQGEADRFAKLDENIEKYQKQREDQHILRFTD